MSKLLYVEKGASLDDYKILEVFEMGERSVYRVEEDDDEEKFSVEKTDDDILEIEDDFHAETLIEEEKIPDIETQSVNMSRLRRFHDVTGDRAKNTVVVMDSGIDSSHSVFDNVSVTQHDALSRPVREVDPTDSNGHGTAVSGQIARINPDAKLIGLRIFGDQGRTGSSIVLRAYQWLNNNAEKYDIVNMSWGASSNSRVINRVHEDLIDTGTQDVVASGNTGGKAGSPGTSESAYSVGSCNVQGKMSEFSSYNPNRDNPEITATGENVRLARASGTSMGRPENENYTVANGTSFSAPFAAGVISTAQNPSELADRLLKHSRDIEGTPRDGSGVLDHKASVPDSEQPKPTPEPEPEPKPDTPEVVESADAKVWSFVGRDSMFISADLLESGQYTAELRDDGTVLIRPK